MANDIERGLRSGTFIAAQLDHMNADTLGMDLLSESAGLSDLGKT